MNEIEQALHEHHRNMHSEISIETASKYESGESSESPAIAFAVVKTVMPDSPASDAGLIEGDRIVRFGDIHAGNHEGLTRLSTIVQQNEGFPINVRLIRRIDEARASADLNLSLTPRRGWGGRGMLGCHIIPS